MTAIRHPFIPSPSSLHIMTTCSPLWRRWQEFRLIGQADSGAGPDRGWRLCPALCRPAAAVGDLGRVLRPNHRQVSLKYFTQFSTPITCLIFGASCAIPGDGHRRRNRRHHHRLYLCPALVRCSMPFGRSVHVVTLLPTISPPFAIAIAAILLFGRNGLISRQILGIVLARRQ